MTYAGLATHHVYDVDGSRLKKIDSTGTTLYLGLVEIRNFGAGAAIEEILTYPADQLRFKWDGGANPDVLYLHRDQLNSVRTTSVGTPGDPDIGE